MKIKTTKYIINELSKLQHYKPLEFYFQYKEFLDLLSPNHKMMIDKIFVKNHTLFIVAKHHIAYIELNHDNTKKTIKFLLKSYTNAKSLSIFQNIKEIKVFTNKYLKNNNTENLKNKFFIELSCAKFNNNIKNPKLHEKFENIREVIKNARK